MKVPGCSTPAGRRYLDCYNNVPVVGHGHPRVVRAVAEQQRLLATHSRYLHEAIVELAERLQATLPPALDAVIVVNSGSEANDLAWRIARAATGHAGALVTDYAYHGLTEATHALSPEEWAAGERPAHVATVPAPDGYRGAYRRDQAGWAERYAAHVDEAVAGLGERGLAAMFADPAFTADGILAPPPGYLREAARRVRAHGGLLIADEVQAGHGRCGSHLWSFQPSGIEPDMVVMGKPMGNGFPVAALVVRSDVLAAVPAETELFSTFGGNPVACAAALAVLAVIEDEGLTQNAAEMGGYLREGLLALQRRHPVIGDVRGEGLLLGVELVEDPETRAPAAGRADQVTEAMRDRGILLGTTGPAGNVLKIRPPLVFRRDHADLLLETLDDVLGALSGVLRHVCLLQGCDKARTSPPADLDRGGSVTGRSGTLPIESSSSRASRSPSGSGARPRRPVRGRSCSSASSVRPSTRRASARCGCSLGGGSGSAEHVLAPRGAASAVWPSLASWRRCAPGRHRARVAFELLTFGAAASAARASFLHEQVAAQLSEVSALRPGCARPRRRRFVCG